MKKKLLPGDKAIFFDGRAFLSNDVEIIKKREDLGEVYTYKNTSIKSSSEMHTIVAYLYKIDKEGISELLNDIECEIMSLKRLRKKIEDKYLE